MVRPNKIGHEMSDLSFEIVSLLIEHGPMKTAQIRDQLANRGIELGREAAPMVGLRLERQGTITRTNEGKAHIFTVSEAGRAAWIQRFNEMTSLTKRHAKLHRKISST